MDGFGEFDYTTDAEFMPGIVVRGFNNVSTGVGKQHLDECTKRAESLAIPKLSTAQLKDAYATATRFLRCLREAGFDMGTIVSEQQFVAVAGAVDPLSSRWNDAVPQAGFAEAAARCDLLSRPR